MINKDDFNEKIEMNVRKIVQKYELLQEGERIAVALSGGKDSILTLHMLNNLKEEYKIDLIGITIDEGIHGYRKEGIEITQKIIGDMGIQLIQKSFFEEFNFNLDDISKKYKSACIPCGVFRRYLLNKSAYEVKADKIATGHNMDDEIQSFIMSFARADLRKFSKFGPKLNMIHPKLIPRIKPLWNISEKEVGTWAILNDIKVHFDECPYANMSARSKMKEYLNKIESQKKGTKLNIFKSLNKTLHFESEKTNIYECEKCGEPSSLNICKTCEMLHELENIN